MMIPKTKHILDKIEKIRADVDRDALVEMKDYWDGFRDGVSVIFGVVDKLQNDVVVPIEEALNRKWNENEGSD